MKDNEDRIIEFDREIKEILLKYVDDIEYGQFAAQFIKFGISLAFGVTDSHQKAIELINPAIKAGMEQYEEIKEQVNDHIKEGLKNGDFF